MTTIAKTLGTLALATCSLSPVAAEEDKTGWYAGINLGQSRAHIDDEAITGNLIGAGLTSVSIKDDDRDIGYKLLGGYQFNRLLAVEGGYFDLGKFGYQATTVPTGSQSGGIKIKGINLDLLGFLPFTERFSAFGRLGANYARIDDSFSTTGSVPAMAPTASKSSTSYKVGMGVQYDFTRSLSMRLEAERYRIDDAVGSKGDIDLLSAGLIYRFGKNDPPPPPPPVAARVAPVVAPVILVVVAPKPLPPVTPRAAAPLPAPAPAPIPRLAVAFSTDSFYQFDSAELSSTGKAELDHFAAELKGLSFGVITVVGHTDRFGTHAYNQKLSEERAEAVKAYLVGTAGMDASKIETRGAEETEPMTLPGDCVGKIATRKMIECLQEDRRVEVDVTLTPERK